MINNKYDIYYSIDLLGWFNIKEFLEYKKNLYEIWIWYWYLYFDDKKFYFYGFFLLCDVVYDMKFIYSVIVI